MSQFDLGNPPPDSKWKLTVESDETVADQWVRVGKQILLIFLSAGAATTLFVICVQSLRDPSASADEKRWAMAYLTGTIGALVGYLVRK